MRTYLSWFCYLACCIGVPSARGQGIDWQEDYAHGRARARALNRPLIVCVHGDNCIMCRKLDATTFRDQAVVAAIQKDFIAVRLHEKKHPDVVASLKVQSLPMTYLASPDGTIVTTVDGYVDAPTMEKRIQESLLRLRGHQPAATSVPLVVDGWGVQSMYPGAMPWWYQMPYWGSQDPGYGNYPAAGWGFQAPSWSESVTPSYPSCRG